jgi:hypothetical protein
VSADTADNGLIEHIAKRGIDASLYAYAREYIYGVGDIPTEPFSFVGHNYLIGIYQDMHPYIVVEKSAQMGASVYAMTKSFYVCEKLNKNVIYFFPTDSDVQEFSKTRVGPLLESSPHLSRITGKNDSQGLRQVGAGWLYFRGMKSSIAMKSVPADFLVFDELDEVSEQAEALADQRLNHSRLKWRLKLSTPTFEGYGIDRDFQRSDMRYWNLICKKCNAKNICEEQFPEIVHEVSDTEAYLQCYKCLTKLEPGYGKWIAKHPEVNRIRGYHICGLYSTYMSLTDLLVEYRDGRRREEFFRSKLGLPWTSTEDRVTRSMVEACIDPDLEQHPDEHCYMGVDQRGSELHIVIRKRQKFATKSELLCITKVAKFDQLDFYVRRYDVDLCVIDALPNQHSARDFASRFPGRVYLNYYVESQKADYIWNDPKPYDVGDEWNVKVNRTEAIDAMYEEIRRREISLPRDYPTEFVDQMLNLGRKNQTDPDDGTILRAVYVRLGIDHYAHANCYSLIAQSRYGTKASSIIVKPKSLSRVVGYARHFEMGSRF